QIVANTTVVPSVPTTGLNFSLLNNSNGNTHVVVDVAGYFYAPQAPACQTVTQTVGVGTGTNFSLTASCTIGSRVSMGGCATTATNAGTDWQSDTFGAGESWLCAGQNNTGQAVIVTSQAYCCLKPGR